MEIKAGSKELIEKYKFIIDTSNDFVSFVNRDYVFEAANKMYCRAHRKKEEEIIGRTLVDIWGEEVFTKIIKLHFDSCLEGNKVSYQSWFEFPALGSRFFDVTYIPYRNAKGQITHVAVVSRDSTERKKAEEVLEKIHYKRGRYFVASQASKQRKINKIVTPPAIDAILVIAMTTIAAFLAISFNFFDIIHVPFPILEELDIDEFVIPTFVSIFALIWYAWRRGKESIRFFAERKIAEEELIESEEKYRSIFEQAADSIVLIDSMTGNFVEFNENAYQNLGYTRDEFMRMNISDIEIAKSSQEVISYMEKIDEKSNHNFQTKYITKSGKGKNVLVNNKVIFVKGRRLIQSIWHDITDFLLMQEMDRKRREAEESSRMKSQFLTNMSHELRTPLNSVIGFSQVLLDETFGGLKKKQYEYIADILSSGKHLLGLINDILDISKIEAGVTELDVSQVSVKEFLETIIGAFRPQVWKKVIEFYISIEEGVGEIIADELRMREVMFNLLSNAVKFTPYEGKIGVEAYGDKDQVVISIWDNGIGIAREDQERIFYEFKQLENVITKKSGGAGLGLSLAKKIIELHGGSIKVESEYNKGAKFTLTLPRRPRPVSLADILKSFIKKARQETLPLSVISLKIREIENIRSALGEEGFKKLLHEMEEIIKNVVRKPDATVRYKDKLLIVLVLSGQKDAKAIAERIKSALHNYKFTYDIADVLEVNVMLYPNDFVDIETFTQKIEGVLKNKTDKG